MQKCEQMIKILKEMNWSIGSIFLTVIIGWWCYFYIWRRKKRIEKIAPTVTNNYIIPKGSMGWPVIGETLEFIACGYASRPLSFMKKRRLMYGKVFKSHILGRPIIISTDAEVNKVVLQNDGRTFIPFYPKSIMELLGKCSILQTNGDLHKRLHGVVGGFLKSPLLKEYITKDIEKSMIQSFVNWKYKQYIYIQDEAKEITFEVLVRILLGIGPGEEMQLLRREFGEFIKGLICLPIKFPGTTLYKSLKAKERMLKLIKKIIESKMRSSERTITDVADVLLKEMNGTTDLQRLTIDSICENIIEMMIPGEDTVPTLMTLAIKYLSDSPSALKLLLEENIKLKREKMASGECYAWTDYMALPFTQHVINEALRMGNIINAVWRKALDDVKIKSYLIPKGWCVLASLTSIHLDEENYEKPLEFDPWRWQQREGKSQSTFTPFGGGQRLCPGMELSRLEVSIFLHHFVTTFSWVAEADTIITFPTVKMKNRLPITVSPIATY